MMWFACQWCLYQRMASAPAARRTSENPKPTRVGFGQHADRARLAVGRNHLLPGPAHLVRTFDEHSPIGLLDGTAGLVGTVIVEALIALERWAEDADVTLVLR